MATTLVDTDLHVLYYGASSEFPATGLGPPLILESLTYIDCYMDDVISAVQGPPYRQHRVFDGTVRAIKCLLPSLPGEIKDSVIMKKLVAGEEDWTFIKEVLGWILDTDAGTVTLLERKLEELLTLVDIPATQCRMGQKDLERLVGKIRSMHIAVSGAVAHLFHIQRALNQGGVDQAWLSAAFHRELANWKALALQAASRPTHLAEIVRREPTHLGFCEAPGLGAGGVWLNPTRTGQNLVWRHPWPPEIIASLVSSTNPQGTITKSDLELPALVLQEAVLLEAVPKAPMAAPRSGSDNTPTVSWNTHESSITNPVVAYLLRICALHSRKFFLNPSVFIIWAKKTAWPTILHVYFIYLTPTFSPTCLSSTPSCTICGRSPSCRQNCFPA